MTPDFFAECYCQHNEAGENNFSSYYRSEWIGFHQVWRRYYCVQPLPKLDISSAAKEIYQSLLLGVTFVWKVFEVQFQEPLDAVLQSGVETAGVDEVLVISCPTLLKGQRLSAAVWMSKSHWYECLCQCAVGYNVSGGVWVPVLFWIAIKCLVKLLIGEKEDVVGPIKSGVLMLDEVAMQKSAMFYVEAKVLYYMPAAGIYHSPLWRTHLQHISVVRCTVLLDERSSQVLQRFNLYTTMPEGRNKGS